MLKFFYLTIFTLFSFGLLYYLLAEGLTPYGSDNILIVENIFIVDVVLIISFSSFFGLLHTIIDKLFFQKFYEQPRFLLGLRRGFLISFSLVTILTLKIFGISEIYVMILVVILAILIEILSIFITKNKKKREQEKLVEQKIINSP